MNANPSDEMPDDIDFSQGLRGRFYREDMTLNLSFYLDCKVQARLTRLATKKGTNFPISPMRCCAKISNSSTWRPSRISIDHHHR